MIGFTVFTGGDADLGADMRRGPDEIKFSKNERGSGLGIPQQRPRLNARYSAEFTTISRTFA